MAFRLSIFVIIAIGLHSCDCKQLAEGYVFDKDTKLPLEKVYVHKNTKEYGEETSKNGYFGLSGISGGLCKCPPMKIILSKEGYETISVEVENRTSVFDEDTIYLKKKK